MTRPAHDAFADIAAWEIVEPALPMLVRLLVGGHDAGAGHIAASQWREIHALAVETWVHPMLAARLEANPAVLAQVPADIRRLLPLDRLAARARRRGYERALSPVMADWNDAGIEPLLLKGAALEATHYGDGMRILNDVDVLVDAADFETAARILERHGFVRHPLHGESADENRQRYSGWVFTKRRSERGDLFIVDLHYRLQPRDSPYALDARAFTERSAPITFAGGCARVPSPEHSVLHYAVQIANDLKLTTQRLADVATLLRGANEGRAFDWTMLCHAADDAGARGALVLLLSWGAGTGSVAGEVAGQVRIDCRPVARAAITALLDARFLSSRFTLHAAASHFFAGRLADTAAAARSMPVRVWGASRLAGTSWARSAWLALRSAPIGAALFAASAVASRVEPGSPADQIARAALWRRTR